MSPPGEGAGGTGGRPGADARCPGAGGPAAGGARPLAGRVVVITRPRDQADALALPLRGLGAEVVVAPVIRIVPRPLDEEARRVLAGVARYDLVVFTSVNGVRVFADDLETAGPGLAVLGAAAGPGTSRPSLAAIGPATAAALEGRGLACDVVAEEYVAEGLLAALERRGVAPAGARVLIPRAAEARSVLPDRLRERGALVDVLPVYDTLPAETLDVSRARVETADFITFTSSSTARAFARLMGSGAGPGERTLAERLAAARLCSIGPVTSATLRELGLTVAVEAREYTTAGLVAAIAAAG